MAHRTTAAGDTPGADGREPVAFRRWQSSFIPDLFFVDSTEHGFAYASHLHQDVMEILWVRSGRCEMVCRGRRYALRRGDAVAIAPNEVHAGGACTSSLFSFTSLHVPAAIIGALFGAESSRGSDSPLSPVQLLAGDFAAHLYRDLVGGLQQAASPADELACLEDGLSRLVRGTLPASCTAISVADEHPAIRKARSLLGRGFTESMDVGTLASEVGLHQRYLISLFKSMIGIPPHQYQIALRLDLGRRLLQSEVPLSNIASTAGFADQSHFSRLFKRTYRMTPSAFRSNTIPF